jgi:hypothetical protein
MFPKDYARPATMPLFANYPEELKVSGTAMNLLK